MSELLEVTREGRLLYVTMNRPEKRNALNAALCRELTAAFAGAQQDAEVGAILLTGRGSTFSAGMDLFEAGTADAGELADVQERLFTAFAWLRKPLIAVVQGPALAGGTGLVANAHIAIASEDATFGLTEIHIGLWPFVIFRAMVHAIGERRAVELSLSGRKLNAEEAYHCGLVHLVAPRGALDTTARAMAWGIAEASPDAVASGMAFVAATRGLDLEETGRLARRHRQEIFESEEFRRKLGEFGRKR